MKSPKLTSSLAALGVSSLFLAASAQAADIYWDGDGVTNPGAGTLDNSYAQNPNFGTGTFPDLGGILGGAPYTYWNTAMDGSGTNVGLATGDNLYFGFGSTPVIPTVVLAGHNGAIAPVASLNFGTNATYNIVDNPAWNGLGLQTNATVDVATGMTATIGTGAISAGNVGIKNGGGTLVYATGAFDQTASYVINAGTFLVEQNNVGTTLAGPVISGAGKLSYRGNAAPAFGQEWDIRSTNTFSGGFDLLQGQIRVGANSAGAFGAPTSGPLGTGMFTIGGEGNAVVYSDGGRTLHNNITVASGPGTKTLLNANGANNIWSGNMTLNDDLTVETNGPGTPSSTHNIYNVTGTGGFIVGDGVDATTLRLRESGGNNTYSGTTTVLTNSTVLVGEPGVTSDFSVMNLAGGTFQSGGATTQTVRGFTGNGTILTDPALITLGIRTQTGDDLSFSGTWSLGNAATYIVVNGVNGAGGVQNFDSAVGAFGRMDVINGAVVNVNSTLDASAGATDIVVEAGGVLGGTGTITGDILVGDNTAGNAFISAGNSIGTLNVIGNVDFTFKNDGSMISEIDTAGDISDLLNITGNVIFGSGSVIDVNNIAGALLLGDTFDLLDWTGSITGGNLVAFDFTNAALDTGLSWDTSSFGTDGTISVVPEPSAYALLGGLLALTWVMTRRRQA